MYLFRRMNGPNTPILLKMNLKTGLSTTIHAKSEETDVSTHDITSSCQEKNVEEIDGIIERPTSNGSCEEDSRPGSCSLQESLLNVTLPTHGEKSRKRKNLHKADKDIDKKIAAMWDQEKQRNEKLEKRKVSELDHIASVAAVTKQKEEIVDFIDLSDDEKPSTSKGIKSDIEIIDISDEDDDASSSSCNTNYRRIAPTFRFSFGDLRRPRPFLTKSERDQQEKALQIEKKRLKTKNFDHFDKELDPSMDGRLLVNPGHPVSDPAIYVAPHLTGVLQPHQLGGVRFMYDNVIESMDEYSKNEKEGGLGCILAHSMGLGKTLQVITFTEVLFRATNARKVVIIMPINTIQNWYNEFNRWIPKFTDTGEVMRKFELFLFGDSVKTFDQRMDMIEEWTEKGGVLLIGYDMFRLLINSTKPKKHTKKMKMNLNGKVEESEREKKKREKEETFDQGLTPAGRLKKEANEFVLSSLIDPGPDLVVCDEGHKIKNLNTEIALSLSAIKTKRRIVLTGYPLQNNLMEYYCMVNFVRPDYLGTKKSFASTFERPIKNGQCVDSTTSDVKLAMQRTHILIEMLRGFVQRRTQHLLRQILPESKEYVLLVRKSPIQHILYRSFVANAYAEFSTGNSATFNPLKAFAACSKFWNHPDVLWRCIQRAKEERQAKEREEKEKEERERQVNGFHTMQYNQSMNHFALFDPFAPEHRPQNMMTPFQYGNYPNGSNGYMNSFYSPSMPSVNPYKMTLATAIAEELDDLEETKGMKLDWAEPCMIGYQPGQLENSAKMVITMQLIDGVTRLGEKILLFSQNLSTLSMVEEFICRRKLITPDGEKMWMKNVNYYRFDGATSGTEREKLINKFNRDPNVYLFLISTKAGSLGVNLVSASRCIIFDACWNPCHDAQAVCRIYRYGQQRKTFIYRLVMDNSMEKAIFNRQISKNGLQQRVVDEQLVDANVTQKEIESLLTYDESQDVINSYHDTTKWNIVDDVLRTIAHTQSCIFSQEPFLHESLMLEREEGLSEQEKMEAIALYEKEKAEETNGRNYNINQIGDVSRHTNTCSYSLIQQSPLPPFNPPIRSTPAIPLMISQKNRGGATLGSLVKSNEYQRFAPSPILPSRPLIIPGASSPISSITSSKYPVIIRNDVSLPIVGKNSQLVTIPRGTNAQLFDGGPTNRKLSVMGMQLMDATGVDLNYLIGRSDSSLNQSTSSSFIPIQQDVIELD